MRYFLLRGAVIPKAFQPRSWLGCRRWVQVGWHWAGWQLPGPWGNCEEPCCAPARREHRQPGRSRSRKGWVYACFSDGGCFQMKQLVLEKKLKLFGIKQINSSADRWSGRYTRSVCEARSHLALMFLGNRFVLIAHNVWAQWGRVKNWDVGLFSFLFRGESRFFQYNSILVPMMWEYLLC